MSSKYILMGSMTIPEFANSPVGTEAKFLLTDLPDARFEAAKSIKGGCTRAGSLCVQKTTLVLFESDDKSHFASHKMITCTITAVREGYSEKRR